MHKSIIAAVLLTTCAACQNSGVVQREAEIVPSTRYDDIACDALARERDALAARHGVPADAERPPQDESAIPGLGIFIPDGRSERERAKARAVGEISAMNRSMERRRCGQE